MKLPQNVKFIISRLAEFGYRADIVGGCVRDFLLGEEPNDYDITTNALPDDMHRVFYDVRTLDTGIKHGTLTVILNGEPYEVTTYRLDGEYSDGRHPDSVSFTSSLYDDLARRDFTVNAMAYSESRGITDLFCGREDLENKIIRAVGNPERRFTEDGLRILRALRFASTLDFTLDGETAAALRKTKELLKSVSCERVYTEWKKLIAGVGAHRILNEFSDVIAVVIPQLSDVQLSPAERFLKASPTVRELSLFASKYGCTAAESFLSAMTELKCDNKHKKYGVTVLCGMVEEFDSEYALRRLLVKYGEDVSRGIVELNLVLGRAVCEDLRRLGNLIESGFCYRMSDMKINGRDLESLGIRGRRVGEILEKLLMLIAEGRLENEREELLKEVAKEL